MKLATSADVLTKLGASQNIDSQRQADAGLEYATIQIENVLDTPLASADLQDYFTYEASIYEGSFAPIRLLTSRGFLTEPPRVYLSTDGSALPDDLTALTALDTAYYTYDLEQGVVTLNYAPTLGLQTIAISYSSGFADGGSGVPEWLKQAAIGYAIQNTGLHGIGYNKKDLRDKAEGQTRIAYAVLSQHIRTRRGLTPARTLAG